MYFIIILHMKNKNKQSLIINNLNIFEKIGF